MAADLYVNVVKGVLEHAAEEVAAIKYSFNNGEFFVEARRLDPLRLDRYTDTDNA